MQFENNRNYEKKFQKLIKAYTYIKRQLYCKYSVQWHM